MTGLDWFRSLIIFGVAVYTVMEALELHVFEATILCFLVIVCVFHTMDVRDHIIKKTREDKP